MSCFDIELTTGTRERQTSRGRLEVRIVQMQKSTCDVGGVVGGEIGTVRLTGIALRSEQGGGLLHAYGKVCKDLHHRVTRNIVTLITGIPRREQVDKVTQLYHVDYNSCNQSSHKSEVRDASRPSPSSS